MIILGLNAFHGDSSACLVRDGKVVAAAEEERFRRVKHWAGVPLRAVEFCLEAGGIGLGEVDHVAINSDPRAHFGSKLRYALGGSAGARLLKEKLAVRRHRHDVGGALEKHFSLGPGALKVHRVEHHLCHLSSAFYCSPFPEAAVVSVDGFGDFSSAAWGQGSKGGVATGGYVHFPHSLGIFYQALTQYLGFPNYGDEYKVMGLAPYGEPAFMGEMAEVLRIRGGGSFELNLDYFRHHREPIGFDWDACAPEVGTLYSPALEELLGPARRKGEPIGQRHRDLARSVQVAYETAFFALLNAVHDRYGVPDLALAGGCAMNSVANGKVRARTPFRCLYVQPAAGDAGGAVGAALELWRQLDGGIVTGAMPHAFLGPEFTDRQLGQLLDRAAGWLPAGKFSRERVGDETTLCERVAALIADGKVVGWFQGRMEWGPRALGNRSILADPRRPDMQEILNMKIKRRESFRPFAPSVLRERVGEWFEEEDDVPFMMKVYPVREERRHEIPAVTHVDGSGRLQTVARTTNPRHYRLISSFEAITGVPMLLNTSFNENEPIVCHPKEALECFLRTSMDVLVLGSHLLRRRAAVEGEGTTA